MKKIIFTLIIIHFSLLFANAQWVLQHDYIPYKSFHHIFFINRYTGWVCGDGIIKKTTNGGNDWIEQFHPATDKYLMYIYPVDSNTVYCVGYFQTILKTTNGGSNWFAIRNGTTGPSYWTTYFLNKDTGWISGSGFTVLRTTNGCRTFDSIVISPITFIYDIRFKDAMTGIMCGDVGQVKKTTNGGYNWFNVNIPLSVMSLFYKMWVNENQFCYLAGGEGRVFYSSDFGSNWDSIGHIQLPPQTLLYSICFPNARTGWAGGEYGVLYKTTNGGHNWRQENTLNYKGYNSSIWFHDTLVGWVAGGGCKILHTTNGGEPLINVPNNNGNIIKKFDLFQNYPNPFNNQTNIEFNIFKNDNYKISIIDLLGREVDVLLNKRLKEGNYKIIFNSRNLSSGIYFCVLNSENEIMKRKFVIIK